MGLFSRWTRPAWEKGAEKAARAAAAGDHGVAVRLYDDALSAAPEAARADLVEARRSSSEVVYATNLAEGEARERAGHLERARDHFELASELAPCDADREAAEQALRRLTQAIRGAKSAAEQPSVPDADVELDDDQTYSVLIGALPDELAEAYEDRDAAFRAAYMKMHRGEIDAALAGFEALVSDDDAPVWIEVGRCRRAVGDHVGAVEALSKAEAYAPDWNLVRLLLSSACLDADEPERAEQALQRAVDFAPEDPQVLMAVCRMALARNEPSYGLEAAEAGLEIDPGNRALGLLQARLFEVAGDDDKAITGYEKRIQQTWRYDAHEGKLYLDYDAALFAAHLYRRTGRDPKRAVELFRGLMAVSDPGERWAHELGLADVLLSSGQRSEADSILADLERVIPPAEVLALCRVADLRADEELLERRLEGLNSEERQAWERAQEERQGR